MGSVSTAIPLPDGKVLVNDILKRRVLLLSSMRASAAGRFDDAERTIVEVRQLATLCDDPALALALVGHQLLTLRLQRRDDEVVAMMDELPKTMAGSPISEPMTALTRLSVFARMEDVDRAREELTRLEPYVEKFKNDSDFCAMVAEGVALVGSSDLKKMLRTCVEGGSPELTMGHVIMFYEGPAARVIGLLDAALGETSRAIDHLSEALARSTARRLRPWICQIHYDLGKVLLGAGREAEARPHLERAAELAESLGMHPLARAARSRLEGAAPGPSAPAPSLREDRAELALEHEGEVWRVRYGSRTLSIRDTRGMQLLARLVERPGEEIHALALSGDEGPNVAESDAGEHLDETARNAYRRRLVELEAAIDEAESLADRGRLERLERERDALVAELSRAVGLGGRARSAGSATERARVNVRKRLKQAIRSIEEADRELGRYLSKAVRTGTFCCFRPY
jgi:tetratricopeptide (TPR) repeat protein